MFLFFSQQIISISTKLWERKDTIAVEASQMKTLETC